MIDSQSLMCKHAYQMMDSVLHDILNSHNFMAHKRAESDDPKEKRELSKLLLTTAFAISQLAQRATYYKAASESEQRAHQYLTTINYN